MNITHLKLSWSVSRGRDTEGYNICRLDDTKQGKRYRCMGGGYDMIGTVFGEWLAENYSDDLLKIAHRAYYQWLRTGLNAERRETPSDSLYGMYADFNEKGEYVRVRLDGGCGIESMIRIAEASGLEVDWEGNKKGHTIGFYVYPKEDK